VMALSSLFFSLMTLLVRSADIAASSISTITTTPVYSFECYLNGLWLWPCPLVALLSR
jgi:hypothetical protein